MFFKVFAIILLTGYSVNCAFDCESSELKGEGLLPKPQKGKAGFAEFPHVVALYRKDAPKPHCAGSIIDESTVITTAFCVKKISNPSELIIRGGLWDLNRTKVEEYSMQQRIASVIIAHPKYASPDRIDNDIALIRVNHPFKFTAHVNKICLTSDKVEVSKKGCYATGWGAESYENQNELSQYLKKVQMDVVDHDVCEKQMKIALKEDDYELSKNFMCAGGFENDLCVGDAGAPLICPLVGSPTKFVLTGLSSFGVKCFTETPGVYTEILKFRDWINYPTEIKIAS